MGGAGGGQGGIGDIIGGAVEEYGPDLIDLIFGGDD